MFFVRLFLIPYIVTLIAELIVALLWGYRSVRDLVTILWVNAVTNLSVTALRYLSNRVFHTQQAQTVTIIILEIFVWLIEWRLYRRFLSKGRYFLLFSLVMNAASFGAGYLVPVVMSWLRG